MPKLSSIMHPFLRKIIISRKASRYWLFIHNLAISSSKFQVYERGVELFTFPVSFEIWNIYLSKFVKRYVNRLLLDQMTPFLITSQGGSKLERARDLFEQALEKCPPKSCRPLFLMYAQLEEDHGLAKRSMAIYNRATQVVNDEDKFEVMWYLFGVSNTSLIASNFCRCSRFTLRKQRRTLVFQPLDPSMNVPWKVRFLPWLQS